MSAGTGRTSRPSRSSHQLSPKTKPPGNFLQRN
jgi:hypothetical protein